MKKKIWLASICTVFLASPPLRASAENFQSNLQEIQQQQIETRMIYRELHNKNFKSRKKLKRQRKK